MAVMLPLTTIPSRNRRLVLILASCLVSIIFVLILVFLSTSHHRHGLASFVPKLSDTRLGEHLPLDLLDPVTDPKSTKKGPSLGSRVGKWQFDTKRDARNYGLSEKQCNGAFPDYYQEIERAVTWRKEEKLPNIEEQQMDISWRDGEIIRLMIYDRQLYVVDHKWADHGYDVPRALALLHQIHRAIVAYHGPLPNVEFTMVLGDWPGDKEARWPVWVLTRHVSEQDKWVMPDFGYWSWPLEVIGDYSQFRADVRENEVSWEEKLHKAVWRGSTDTNKLREDLAHVSDGRSWSDIRPVEWVNMTAMSEESYKNSLTMTDHCNYQYLVHTEGHTYSGRGKYLLNCESVSIVHTPEWIEPHTHLMTESGADQNVVQVERDFSDLNRKMSHYLRNSEEAKTIALRSTKVFRDRYLTPAAQACYWRQMFRAWSSVSFEPQLYRTIKDDLGRVRRKSRGTPFETFVAALVTPDALSDE